VLGAFVALVRASEEFVERTHRHLVEEELSFSEFAVLEALYHLGNLTQVQIGNRILRSRGSITMTIDKLEKRKFVVRDRGKDDRRCITVTLTSKGSEIIGRVFQKHLKILVKEMSVLTSKEQQQLRALCKKLSKDKSSSVIEGA
jgi:MarR family 2-MHQ and catechol resistance regulon transcriptional repressor